MSKDKDHTPTGHERSRRRGQADGMSEDRRKSKPSPKRPKDLPTGHGKSYDKGFEDGRKS